LRTSKTRGYAPVMNDTKWDELRLAMWGLTPKQPKWRTKDLETGFISAWDGDWFYHFRVGGYATIEWVEIHCEPVAQRSVVQQELARVHVPAERTDDGFRVYGFIIPGNSIHFAGF